MLPMKADIAVVHTIDSAASGFHSVSTFSALASATPHDLHPAPGSKVQSALPRVATQAREIPRLRTLVRSPASNTDWPR